MYKFSDRKLAGNALFCTTVVQRLMALPLFCPRHITLCFEVDPKPKRYIKCIARLPKYNNVTHDNIY